MDAYASERDVFVLLVILSYYAILVTQVLYSTQMFTACWVAVNIALTNPSFWVVLTGSRLGSLPQLTVSSWGSMQKSKKTEEQ